MSISDDPIPQYLGSGDATLKDYFPAWVNNIAADATVEGSMLNGAVHGADAVRSIVLTIRSLYEHREFKFASYRPFNSVAVFARLLREKFAGTPIAEHRRQRVLALTQATRLT